MLDHLSYSSITMYLDCPEAWRRKYVAQEPTKSNPALVFGSAFHGAIESELRGGAPAESAWTETWSQALQRDVIEWGGTTPEGQYNEGLRLLSHPTVKTVIMSLVARRDELGPLIERKVTLNVPGVPIPVIGYIDLVLADGSVCDLKTSRASWSEAKASDSLQGLFYLAALNQAGQDWHGWRFRHVVFVKTKEPKVQVLENTHTPGEMFFLFRVVQAVWQGIAREVFPPNPGSWKCNAQYCDFWRNCRGRYV